MDFWPLVTLQVWRRPLTALCPHVCLCTGTRVCTGTCLWDACPRRSPHGAHWPVQHSLANGFLFQLEKKSPAEPAASRKGEFIGPAQSYKGGEGPWEVSGLTPHPREEWIMNTDHVVQGFALLDLESSEGHTFPNLSLGPPFSHWNIFPFISSQKLILYLVVSGIHFTVDMHFPAETAAAKTGSVNSVSWAWKRLVLKHFRIWSYYESPVIKCWIVSAAWWNA